MTMRVAVLRGGVGSEHEVSMQSGSTVLKHLTSDEEKHNFQTIDIFVDRTGDWYLRGIRQSPEVALSSVDVVWNALHGEYGEDGTVQSILDRHNVPYTGSSAYASRIGMNKVFTKDILKKAGVLTPRSITLQVSSTLDNDIVSAFRSFCQPSVIKPIQSGSSIGITIARSFHDFERGVREAFQHSPQVLIEEFIEGKEATCGVVDQLRDEAFYTLPPMEIVLNEGSSFFDYEAKYEGNTLERCPGNFTLKELTKLKGAALTAHKALGLRHYSRSDFIVSPKGVYYLESNTLPELRDTSSMARSLSAVGVSLQEFITHTVNLSLNR